jgi:hypothetical protein
LSKRTFARIEARIIARIMGLALLVAASFATVGFNYFTVTQILRARTRVPWLDEWAMIQEFVLYKRGSPLFPILWSSYWGHRLVVPRLIFFANLQWASRGENIRFRINMTETASDGELCLEHAVYVPAGLRRIQRRLRLSGA